MGQEKETNVECLTSLYPKSIPHFHAKVQYCFVPKLHLSQLPVIPPSAQSVDWLIGKLDWGDNLRSWIPTGFERYVRILHPAYISVGKELATREIAVPWAIVSQWSGKRLHATSHIQDVMVRANGHDWRRRGEGGDEPRQGYLEEAPLSCLLAHLLEATTTPKEIWMLIWFGYGGPADTIGLPIEVSEQVTASGRKYFLRLGEIASLEEEHLDSLFEHAPSFWWPDDRSWFVSCDIDASSTYLGGSKELIDQILGDPCLETFPAKLDEPYGGLYVSNPVVDSNDGYVPPRNRFKSFLRHRLFRSRGRAGSSEYFLRKSRWWEWWMKP